MAMSLYLVPVQGALYSITAVSYTHLDGGVKAKAEGTDRAVLAWKGEYEEGDRILFQVPQTGSFYVIRVDDTMDCLLYTSRCV